MAVGELKGLQVHWGLVEAETVPWGNLSVLYLHTIVVMTAVEERLPLEVRHYIFYRVRHILTLGISAADTVVEVLLVPRSWLNPLVRHLAVLHCVLVRATGIVEPTYDPLHGISDHVDVDGLGQIELIEVDPIDVTYIESAFFQARDILCHLLLFVFSHLPYRRIA